MKKLLVIFIIINITYNSFSNEVIKFDIKGIISNDINLNLKTTLKENLNYQETKQIGYNFFTPGLVLMSIGWVTMGCGTLVCGFWGFDWISVTIVYGGGGGLFLIGLPFFIIGIVYLYKSRQQRLNQIKEKKLSYLPIIDINQRFVNLGLSMTF